MRLIALFVNLLFNLALVALVGGAAALLLVYWHVEPELPSIEILKDVRLQVPLRVFSRDGKLLAEFGKNVAFPWATRKSLRVFSRHFWRPRMTVFTNIPELITRL